ncbi:hypothetical protein R6Q59_031807 [Mikania micrantha]
MVVCLVEGLDSGLVASDFPGLVVDFVSGFVVGDFLGLMVDFVLDPLMVGLFVSGHLEVGLFVLGPLVVDLFVLVPLAMDLFVSVLLVVGHLVGAFCSGLLAEFDSGLEVVHFGVFYARMQD